MRKSLFITGGTGMVGKALIPLFLRESDLDIYILVHKLGSDLQKETLLENAFRLTKTEIEKFLERVYLLSGDITEQDLGIEKQARQKLEKKVNYIIHAAATTRFDLLIEEARKINVEGTRHVISLAKKCDKLERFGFISTAYVSGKRKGTIYENERAHECGFVNTYEQTKYEAEELIETIKPYIPATIYRLSTILGDSQTGKVDHFTAPHQSLRIMYLGLASMIPGTPDYSVDLIASDYTALTLFKLFLSHFKSNQTFHLVGGRAKSYSLQELINESYRYLGEFDPDWKMRDYPKPIIASEEAFELFLKSVNEADNPLLRGVVSALGHFAHQLNYPKEFDITNLKSYLPDYEKNLPDVRQYYPKIVEYCLKTKWGRNV